MGLQYVCTPDCKPVRIGLLADSHGNLEATEQSLSVLEERGADCIIHLGDFCDSVKNNGLADMIRVLSHHRVVVVKGNNDHQVEKMLRDSTEFLNHHRDSILDYLADIPMTHVLDDICFAHSLPFDALRSFYEPIDIGTAWRANRLFQASPYQTLFCGHSHMPVLFRWKDGVVTREMVTPGEAVPLIPSERYIIIVGAVYEGECAILDREALTYERVKLF